ncbi:MAG: YdeI/OmpD-associated family protein [Acidimicrobiales bacterium]
MSDTLNAVELPELLVADVGEWRRWLRTHHTNSQGVWLVLARKGTTDPTTVSYDEALEEAICFGWIDGQIGRRDTSTFRRRFTPRNSRSPWSQRNTVIAERLIVTGRMQRTGEDEVRKAKEDGRWEAAYAGQASIAVPEDLLAALSANPRAKAMFATLTRANRYAILYRIGNAKKLETRARRIGQFVEMLARGETIHPQAPRTSK